MVCYNYYTHHEVVFIPKNETQCTQGKTLFLLFAYVISRIQTQIGEKKYWTMFFNHIAVHMRNF